jgi:23S rRNA (adenine2503-C2)-methyltransferase
MILPSILDLSRAELEAWCTETGVPSYRAAQIATWLYRHGARDFADMRNLPADLRARLAETFRIGWPALGTVSRSTDGTRKLLIRLSDGATIESVLMPDGDRLTLCVSTQVGCAMGCGFCATATLGLTRHLRRGEIVGQLLVARALVAESRRRPTLSESTALSEAPERITNMVFMGMGEPLHNYAGTVARSRR